MVDLRASAIFQFFKTVENFQIVLQIYKMLRYVERPIKSILLWILSLVISLVVCFRLIFIYIANLASMPWKPKDRILMEQPACLSDPKYGNHRYVTINKIRFHYVESGDKTKPLMLFIHGFPEFWFSWRHQITESSKDYWVIALDLRGCNQSDKPKIETLVMDLKAFIEHLNRKKCILICHDFGAFIGWRFISQYKHMVENYIMFGNPPLEIYNELALNTMDQFKKSWHYLIYRLNFLPEKLLSAKDFESFSRMWNTKHSDNFTEDDLETYKYVFSKPGALTAALGFFRANLTFVNHSDENKHDGSNGMFVLGQRDRYISQAACISMTNRYPKLRVELIQNANHFVHETSHTAANKIIREFLDSEHIDLKQ